MTETAIQKQLETRIFGRKTFLFSSIDSTNTFAKTLALDGASEGTVVVADHQTVGRGRLNRAWLSEPGMSLLFSLIVRPTMNPERLGVLSLMAAVAVVQGICDITPIELESKWPNDVLIKGKKICGILLESVFQNLELVGVIIGVGLNVNQTVFVDELRDKATSLKLTLGRSVDRNTILALVLKRMENLYEILQAGGHEHILELWKVHTKMLGKGIKISQRGTTIEGIAKSVGANGELIIQSDGVEAKVFAGDVTVIA